MKIPFSIVVCSLMIGLLVGCGGSDPSSALVAANDTNLKRLANLYAAYQSRNDWRGPASEEEFKSFLKNWNPQKLANLGVDPAGIDDLFVSTRDNEPFKVRYGVPGNSMGSDAPVIFEATGVSGSRRVGFLNMTQRDVDEAEYTELWEGKGDSTKPAQRAS